MTAICNADINSENTDVKSLMSNLTVRSSAKYCVAGTLTCRDLVQLKDKVSGNSSDAIMYDNFLSSERFVASTGYFTKNTDGTYRASLDKTFDGQINIDFIEPLNVALVVSFDNLGYPTFHDVTLKRLGTTRKIIANMAYSESQAQIIGTEYDEADPNFSQPVNTVYLRVQVK